jgi:hypothetical protein
MAIMHNFLHNFYNFYFFSLLAMENLPSHLKFRFLNFFFPQISPIKKRLIDTHGLLVYIANRDIVFFFLNFVILQD